MSQTTANIAYRKQNKEIEIIACILKSKLSNNEPLSQWFPTFFFIWPHIIKLVKFLQHSDHIDY